MQVFSGFVYLDAGIRILYKRQVEVEGKEGAMPEKWQARLGALIAKYRGPMMSQTTLAELVTERGGQTVKQALVSEHERGNRWGNHMELIGVYADVLSIPMDEVYEAMGLPHVGPSPTPRGFAELVAQDRTLSKAAKTHLLNQYELLQMATQHERANRQHVSQDDATTPTRTRKRA